MSTTIDSTPRYLVVEIYDVKKKFSVRDTNEDRIICACSRFEDAERIAKLLNKE